MSTRNCLIRILSLTGALLAGQSACSPDEMQGSRGLGIDDGGDAGRDDGGVSSPRGYAVVSGDYSVVSIGVLHPDGKLREREIIHSGSASTGLVTALSGDVKIASNERDPGVLTLIDRFRTDVLTRLDLATGEVLGQVKTQTPNAESADDAYSSNPQDYLFIDRDEAWVSRYEPNPDVDADHPDRGADLIQIDPSDFERTGERIDFSEWNVETEAATVYARPGAIVPIGDLVAVGIDAMALGFDAAGPGMVALVDLEAQRVVHMLEIEGLQNCGDVNPIPNERERVAVGCTGFYRGVQRDGSGLVILKLEDDALEIEHVWRAKEHPDAALTIYGLCALSATELVATAAGGVERDDDGKPLEPNDKLFVIDLESGEQEELLEAGMSYVIGAPAFDAETGLLLVPDATTDGEQRPSAGVRRYKRRDDGSFEELSITRIDEVLPPRHIRSFY
jgi:hypothetical protein